MARMRVAGVTFILALAAIQIWMATNAEGSGRWFAVGTALVLLLAAAFIGRQRGIKVAPTT